MIVPYLEKKYKVALQAAIIEIIDKLYEIEFVTKQQAEIEEPPIKNSANLEAYSRYFIFSLGFDS